MEETEKRRGVGELCVCMCVCLRVRQTEETESEGERVERQKKRERWREKDKSTWHLCFPPSQHWLRLCLGLHGKKHSRHVLCDRQL